VHKKPYLILSIPVVLTGIYFLGPSPGNPDLNTVLPKVSTDLLTLEKEVQAIEEANPQIKSDNQARIIWADSSKQKTRYALVYLHGFSSSQAEGAPVHQDFARRYGCNLYLSRLAGHGLKGDELFKDLTARQLVESAKEAIARASQLGDSLIVMGTSTGAALALYLASEHPEFKGLILYSPIIDFYDKSTAILDKPWGLQIARLVSKGDYVVWSDTAQLRKKYWYQRYRLEGVVALKHFVANAMVPEVFEKVKQPTFLGYYYKNETEQDHTVSVPEELKMFDELGTPASLKRKVAFPKAGHHVIASYITSNDVEGVRAETLRFAEEILRLRPVNKP
jgi:pimeloyl-ACP methyl ester carboxylesterase